MDSPKPTNGKLRVNPIGFIAEAYLISKIKETRVRLKKIVEKLGGLDRERVADNIRKRISLINKE